VGHTLDSVDAKETMTLSVADGGPSGTDSVTVVITPGSTTAPSCAAAPAPGTDDDGRSVVVNDAP